MKFFLVAIFALTAQLITAQTITVKKIYAYKQQILPGKKPGANEKIKATERAETYIKQKMQSYGLTTTITVVQLNSK